MARSESELIEELKGGYAAFGRGDFERATRTFHPDIELFPAGGQPPIRGSQAIRDWMEPDAFESQEIQSIEFTAAGHRVLVRQQTHARGSSSGIELDYVLWSVWTSDSEGLWIRFQIFLEHEEARARKAAGLAG